MSDTNQITGFTLISTNNDRNVLNDVTRDDLVDILNRMFKVSKCDSITKIVDDIIAHINHDGSDPHELEMDQLIESVLEKIYEYWLNYGFHGSYEEFVSHIFRYLKMCTRFSLFIGREVDTVTSVRNVFNAIVDHDLTVNSYDGLSKFSFSEKERKWGGILSGVRINANHVLEYAPEDMPTLEYNQNGDPWYKWDIKIPKKLRNGIINIEVDSDNPKYSVSYKLDTENIWTILSNNTLVVPDMLPNISDPTFDTVKEEVLVYQFKIEYSDTPFILNDIVIHIDLSTTVTDDPTLAELYKEVPHQNFIEKFFNIGDVPNDVFSWYSYINSTCLKGDTATWLPKQCTFNVAAQAHQNRLIESNGNRFSSSLLVPDFRIYSHPYTFEIYTQIIGTFTSHVQTLTNMISLSNVYIGIRIKYGDDIVYKLLTTDLALSNRSLYRFMCTCNFETNTFGIYYQNENGLQYISKKCVVDCNFTLSQKWEVVNPADLVLNSFIGLHELVCYDKIITDTTFVDTITLVDISDRPYVPVERSEITNDYFGFEGSNYNPFNTYPLIK